ncbi:cryptococcal mannosyltransferase 1-domain-containing protein [Leptodontidium sp. MPI-SDFR-AT-0119]|nr:cryptococcal mannosyltransferase 1-domain-containing protein [Leptodontidium sp. MPI-SDFR-AT-0119]
MAIEYNCLPLSSHVVEFKDKLWTQQRRRPSFFSFLGKTLRIWRLRNIGIAFLVWQVTFNVPYTNPRPFTIPANETVYIAANIIDADLINGAWGRSLVELVDLIGKDRVYVSIYGGPTSALKTLERKLDCEARLVSEEEHPIDLKSLPRTPLSTGKTVIKRVAHLAEVRNKALEPLATLNRKFDKVLFINDVYFAPADAARVLWGTNLNAEGVAEYKAVCGMDFVNGWKYYDTFATRDLEGYGLGVPIFPWFANEGHAISRNDVLEGRDAVRVKSCWGGIVAFDARYFQRDHYSLHINATEHFKAPGKSGVEALDLQQLPLRFRSEPEPFWDSSECCLIHADIIALPPFLAPSKELRKEYGDGIFMNPYVRVSYDMSTQKHIWLAQRFERLFAVPQAVINRFAHLPRSNYRRTEVKGGMMEDRVWVASTGVEYWKSKGQYIDFERQANTGGYCGVRKLSVLKEGKGEGNWDNLLDEVPPLDVGL